MSHNEAVSWLLLFLACLDETEALTNYQQVLSSLGLHIEAVYTFRDWSLITGRGGGLKNVRVSM